jgi:PAS domain-containing protein
MIIPQNQQDESNGIYNRIIKGEAINNLKTHLVRKDGKVIDVEVTISPITDESGIIIGQSIIARKIFPENLKEQQKEREEYCETPGDKRVGEAWVNTGITGADFPVMKANGVVHPFHLSNALKMARDYIAILDRAGKCLWANDALIGAVHAESFTDLERKSIALYIAPEFRKIALDSLMEIKKTGNKTVQLMMLSSSGRVPVEANFSAINTEEGDLFGYLAIARNIERDKVEKPKR